jgi:effector-binding domain-containing protein
MVISGIISMFLPSSIELEEMISVFADEEVVQDYIQSYEYKSISSYKLEKENQNWVIKKAKEELGITSRVKIDFGFNPISKFKGLFAKENIEQGLKHKLDSLGVVLEDLPKINRVKVTKVFNENDLWILSIRDSVNQSEISNVHGKLYAEINQFMDKNDIESSQAPIVIYHFWSDTLVDIEAGIPVNDSIILGNKRVRMNKIKKGYVVTATHFGSYERLPETYFGINEWMRKNQVVVTGVPWEVYVTDPANESNPDNWETKIFFPVK